LRLSTLRIVKPPKDIERPSGNRAMTIAFVLWSKMIKSEAEKKSAAACIWISAFGDKTCTENLAY
jgi:hypothetical protein